jgi:hypothetical protein
VLRDIIILARKKLQRCFFVPDLQQMCELEEVCVVKRVYIRYLAISCRSKYAKNT